MIVHAAMLVSHFAFSKPRARLAPMRVWVLGALAVAGCEAGPTCDAGELADRLASPGASVEIGDCAVRGRFRVAPGVTLRGTGPESALVGHELGPVLALDTRGATSRVVGLRVVASGHAAIQLGGDGRAILEDLGVEVPGPGVGLVGEGLASLALRRVTIAGPATAASAAAVPADADATRHATHGLALFEVGDLELTAVDVRGFEMIGALIVDSTTTWSGGEVRECVGAGVVVSGGEATLTDVAVRDLFASSHGLVLSLGLTSMRGAVLRTERLEVARNPQFGLLQDGGEAEHLDLIVRDNGDVGVWAQDGLRSSITGAASVIAGNRVAGLVVAGSSDVTVRDVRIDGTRRGLSAAGTGGGVDAGDGIHLVGDARAVTLDGLTLSGNTRVQIVVDLAATAASEITLAGVRVDGSGAELGLVAQGGALPVGWDAGVTRLGATAANDAAFSGALSVFAGAVREDERAGPPASGGVRGIVMPID